ncbi:mos, partial [Symbiodinium sp. KB8]
MAGKETSDAAFVGKGGQGRVFLSTHRGKETATKVVPAASRAASEAEIRAVRRHRNRHIHLVPVYTVFGFDPGEGAEGLVPPGEAQADDTIIVMERAVADIHVIMSHNTHGLGESAFVREWAMQLGHALRFLHARGIAHRDIKPENVLIGLQEGAQDARHALLALTEAAGAGVGAAADVPGAATDVPRAATDLPRAATDLPDAGMPHGATSDTVDTCSSAASVSVASVALEHGFAPTDPLLGPWPAVREELLRLVGTVNRRGDQAATVDPAVRSAAVRRLRSTFMVKLCDFGSSAIQRGSEVGQAPIMGHSACGSRRFASPEVVRAMDMGKRPEIAHLIWPGTLEQWDTVVQRGYDAAACDVYSFGLLVYALASGHLPYAAASLQEKMYRRFVATLFPHVRHSVIGARGSELWSVKVNGPQLRR